MIMNPATHSVNLNALTSDPEQWDQIYKEFTGVAKDWGQRVEYISVSSSELGEEIEVVEEEELYYDENTLQKVLEALKNVSVLTDHLAREAITDMQNAGILFRERKNRP